MNINGLLVSNFLKPYGCFVDFNNRKLVTNRVDISVNKNVCSVNTVSTDTRTKQICICPLAFCSRQKLDTARKQSSHVVGDHRKLNEGTVET